MWLSGKLTLTIIAQKQLFNISIESSTDDTKVQPLKTAKLENKIKYRDQPASLAGFKSIRKTVIVSGKREIEGDTIDVRCLFLQQIFWLRSQPLLPRKFEASVFIKQRIATSKVIERAFNACTFTRLEQRQVPCEWNSALQPLAASQPRRKPVAGRLGR